MPVDAQHDPHVFHLELHGLAALAVFVAIIRHPDLDFDTLQEMTARLLKSTAALSRAEQADADHRTTTEGA